MCGIVGYLAKTPTKLIKRSQLEAATNALRYRGPDGQGTWQSPTKHAGLGHRRLAVCGNKNSKQPIESPNRSIVATVNGEIYDPGDRIRKHLEAEGYPFQTDGDSELALHLYAKHGLRFVDYLRGEFAILIYDRKQDQLVAVRDRFGIKPLVYHQTEEVFWFASQACAMKAAGCELQMDLESVWHSFSFQYTLPDRTLHRNVFQLQPGTLAVVKNGRLTSRIYWDLNYPTIEQTTNSVSSTSIANAEELGLRMDEAVHIRMRGNQPIVCHLSGGIDSCSVLQSAVEGGQVAAAFTVGFSGQPEYDESLLAYEMAQSVMVPLHVVDGSPGKLADAMDMAVTRSESWNVNGHLPAKHLLSNAISDAGYKVALTGEGADELLAGYAHLVLDSLGQQEANGLTATIGRSNANSWGTMLPAGDQLDTSAFKRQLGYVPTFVRAKASLGALLKRFLRDDFCQLFEKRDPYQEWLDSIWNQDQLEDRSVTHRSLYLWTKTALAQNILRTLGDGCEAANGTEGRLPMLDHELFDWAKQIPNKDLFSIDQTPRGYREKIVLRNAMQNRLPQNVLQRGKQPFDAPPLGLAITKDVRIRDRIEAASKNHPYFDAKKIRPFLDQLHLMGFDEHRRMDPLWWMVLSSVKPKEL